MPILEAPTAPTHTLPGAAFTSLATPSRGSRATSVWRVSIAAGTPATPHELTSEEIFVVLSGRADVRLGDEQRTVETGGVIVVPPDTPFALASAGTETLEALCCMPVGGQARLPDGTAFTPPWAA